MADAKTWYTSKNIWLGALAIVGGLVAFAGSMADFMPTTAAPWLAGITALLGVAMIILRLITGEPIAGTAAAIPGLPPKLQKGIEAVEKSLAPLPSDFGPTVLTLIESAANETEFKDNWARLDFVTNALQSQYPDLKVELIQSIIKQLVSLYEQTQVPSSPAEAGPK